MKLGQKGLLRISFKCAEMHLYEKNVNKFKPKDLL